MNASFLHLPRWALGLATTSCALGLIPVSAAADTSGHAPEKTVVLPQPDWTTIENQLARPANDRFDRAIALPAPADPAVPAVFAFAGDNINATAEAGEPNLGNGAAGHTTWWKWTATQDTNVVLYFITSEFRPQIGVYTGAAVNTLAPVPQNLSTDGACRFLARAGTTYHIAVDGIAGGIGQIQIGAILAPAHPSLRLDSSPALAVTPSVETHSPSSDNASGTAATVGNAKTHAIN